MADTTALKNRIRAAVKANDNQEITGPILQQTLLDIIDELSGNIDKFALSIGILTTNRGSGDGVSVSGNVLSINNKYDIYTQKFGFIRLTETKTLTLSSGTGIIWYDAVSNILSSAESNFSNNAILIGVHRGNNVYINGVKQYQKDGITIYCEFTEELILNMTDSKVMAGRINPVSGNAVYEQLQTKGDAITPVSSGNAWLSGNVGQQITFNSNVNYKWVKVDCSNLPVIYIKTYTRNENDYFVKFVDENNIIVKQDFASSTTVYGWKEAVLAIPINAKYVYVECYRPSNFSEMEVNYTMDIKASIEELEQSVNENISKVTIPDFVINAAKATHKRILQWGGTDSYSLLGQITDLHSGGRTTYKHIKYFDGINDLFGFSIICNAGDIGLDVGETEDAAYNLIGNVKSGMSANSLWVFCKGNHDYGTAHISNKIIDNAFNAPYCRRFQERIHREELGYGYTDDIVNKVRYIYLNTSEGNTSAYTMSVTQVTWLISTLINTPNEYSVVVLSHLCIDDIGRWNSYPNDASAYCFIALKSIFSDFVAKTSGSNASLSISWDFTNVDSSIKLACVLAGDSHFDNYIKRNGVNYIVRQGYGYVSAAEMPSGAIHTDFNTAEQCLFDVLAIKNNGNAKVFRIGAGGAERDLAFTY